MMIDLNTAWEPYRPTAEDPWDVREGRPPVPPGRVRRHAGRTRAGVADGHEKTLDRVLAGRPEADDFARTSEFMATERSLPPGRPASAARRRGGSTACCIPPTRSARS